VFGNVNSSPTRTGNDKSAGPPTTSSFFSSFPTIGRGGRVFQPWPTRDDIKFNIFFPVSCMQIKPRTLSFLNTEQFEEWISLGWGSYISEGKRLLIFLSLFSLGGVPFGPNRFRLFYGHLSPLPIFFLFLFFFSLLAHCPRGIPKSLRNFLFLSFSPGVHDPITRFFSEDAFFFSPSTRLEKVVIDRSDTPHFLPIP